MVSLIAIDTLILRFVLIFVYEAVFGIMVLSAKLTTFNPFRTPKCYMVLASDKYSAEYQAGVCLYGGPSNFLVYINFLFTFP